MKTPLEIVKQWDKSIKKDSAWFWYNIRDGLNNSLYRNGKLKCIFAYYKRDGHLTMAMKTPSSGIKVYMLCKEFRQAKKIDTGNFFKTFPEKTYDYRDTNEFDKAKTRVFVNKMVEQ